MKDLGLVMWNMELGMWDLECGIWNEGFGIWNMEYEIRDVGNGMRNMECAIFWGTWNVE